MFRRLKIGTKILLVTISISLVAILVSSIVSGFAARKALEHAAFERLTAVRELKAQQIEGYFGLIGRQVQSLAADRTTISSIRSLKYGLSRIEAGIEGYKEPLMPSIHSHYTNVFANRPGEIADADDTAGNHPDMIPTDPVTLFLQKSYVIETDPDIQQKSVMTNGDDYPYRATHSLIHARLKAFQVRFGYYDIFLIEPEKGRIIYSVAKEIDFGTSLFAGPHAQSNLARVVMEAMALSPGEHAFVDFEVYAPSFDAPAAFVATPVFARSTLIGVLAFQMPVDRINAIMTSNEAWADVGLGKSGETYLVGHDLLLRSQSRFLIEDRDQYLEMIRAIGTSEEIVQQIDNLDNSIGLQKVDTEGTRAALAGETGERIFPDYRGVEVLSSYKPLALAGFDWAVMSEIDKAEAFAASDILIDYLILIASIVLALTIYCAYYFALSLTRPLRDLEDAAEALISGKLDEPITARSADEIGELARKFEKMRVAMKKSFSEVEQQKTVLEKAVKKRTAELDEASAKLNLALGNMPNGIYMLDSDLNYTMHNDRYAEMLNIPRESVADGKSIRDVVRLLANRGDYGEGNPEAITEERVRKIAKSRSGSATITTSSGKTIELRHAVVDGYGVITVASDITDLKDKEQALLAQNEELQVIQKDLKASEERVAKIIQSSPDGIITIDKRGIIETFSASAERIFGYYSEDVIGKNMMILMPKSVGIEHDLYLERYMPGSPSTVIGKKRIVDAMRKDGTVFPLEISVEEVWLGDKMIFLGLMQDITERKKAEAEMRESRNVMQTILDNLPVNVFLRDTNGRFILINKSYEEVQMVNRDDAIGRTLHEVFQKNIADEYLASDVDVIREARVMEFEEVHAIHGDSRTLLVLKFPVYDLEGKIVAIGGIDVDITERKKAEEELSAAKEAAESATQAKSTFLANMSHELRTPMNAIIGYSEMLAEDAEDEGQNEMLEDLNKISAAGKHLLSLINDVLDLSKVEAGKMELYLETFPVADIAKEVANTSASLIEKNNNKFELAVSDDVGEMHADMTKIRQVLFNLISNAAKFSNEGTITLEASREMRADVPWIRFAVSDTGIGIPGNKLEHIFQEFSQADDSTTKDYGGTGLGLALTRRFCEMMGGSINVESEVGVGSSFIVTLPSMVEKKHKGFEDEAVIQSKAPAKALLKKEAVTKGADPKAAK